jgi:hypothetical protein
MLDRSRDVAKTGNLYTNATLDVPERDDKRDHRNCVSWRLLANNE